MRLKQTLRYQFRDFIRPTAIFYGVTIGIFLITWLLAGIITGHYDMGQSTMDMTMLLFLFILGLNSFKNPFKLFQQNGISRRTQLVGFALSALALALITSLIDGVLLPLVVGNTIGEVYQTYAMLYGTPSDFMSRLTFLLWNLLSYYAAICFGYFLTTLFYRMNKPLKLMVSIGVPLLLFVVLPMVEVFVPSFNVFSGLLKFIGWALGIELSVTSLLGLGSGMRVVPMRAVASFAVASVALLGFAYLLMRRATIKEA